MQKWLCSDYFCSVAKSCPTLCDPKLPYPSPSPRVCSNSCSLSQWYHPTILSFVTLFSVSPSIRVVSNMLAFHIRWPKYWSFSFSISPSSECSGLISNRIDWFDLPSPGNSQESSPAPQFESINSSVLSLLYGPTLTFLHDNWKNHCFDYIDLCQQSDVSAF